MSSLSEAIVHKNWELAGLCLLLGMLEALSRIPADSIEGVLDVTNGGGDAQT